MKLSPRDEIIVGVVAIVLLVVILAMVLVRPQLNELGTMQQTLQTEETNVKSAQADLERLKAAKGEALQVQADLVKVGNQVPDSPQLPSFVVQVQDLANESGISFFRIEPKMDSVEVSPSGDYTAVPMELVLNGQFFDMVDFLYRLEHLTREVRISELALGEQQAGGGGGGGDSSGGGGGDSSGGSDSGGAVGGGARKGPLTLKITAKVYVMGVMEGVVPPAPAGGATPGAAGGGATPAP